MLLSYSCLHFFFSFTRWERRVDNRGRVYYVDHNSRTTTWQRPTTDIISNYNQWDSWRNQRSTAFENLQNRFLFPNPATMVQDDPLGALPDGWGKIYIFFLPYKYRYIHSQYFWNFLCLWIFSSILLRYIFIFNFLDF